MKDINDPEFTINIIGDIAGRYDELMLLLNKMPKADLVIGVGDLVDRGPKSRQVLEWFYANQDKAIAIYGNHEDMMVNFCRDPDEWQNRSMWLYNGGTATLDSFRKGADPNTPMHELIPTELVDWVASCPLWWANDDIVISHAPINFDLDELPDQYRKGQHFFIWNRCVPYRRGHHHKYHVYGHNAEMRYHSDDAGDFAMCIDNSSNGELTGMHWPSKEIFRQTYLPRHETLEERARHEQREMTEEEKATMEFLRSLKS